MKSHEFDIIVVGGGHAGVESALAAARMGARTVLVTHDVGEIGRMPCNPAIGGLGKGHLVREIDVLGGEMGVAIDQTGIQFRVLNTKKGPAVRSPRAQADKNAYQRLMMETILGQDSLEVVTDDAKGLIVESGQVRGVSLLGGRILTGARVVLCTGTFLKGLMHVGDNRTTGGREGAASSEGLSGSLADYGFELKRLKTGTPPRLTRQSIDFKQLTRQPGDENPDPFSFRTENFAPDQIDCHMAYTNEHTHRIISESLDRSPLFGGMIKGQGPRYCPSIEDKVVRFADKDRHLLFLEPEGRDTDEIYVNGLSTSLPADVQERVVRSVPGLESAKIVRFGYAIEYDSVPSWQIHRSLETKLVAGLYLAGQVLGTSGYEEAAAQGLVAAVNAVWSLDGKRPLDIGRGEAYIGVLVDDLVTKEINEPYRMFTSRAEHRLHLRCDNAEDRLTDLALELGLLSNRAEKVLAARRMFVRGFNDLLQKTSVFAKEKGMRLMAADYLRFPGMGLGELQKEVQAPDEFWNGIEFLHRTLKETSSSPHLLAGAENQVENDIKYDGYIAKHNRLLRQREHLDQFELPDTLDYKSLTSLSFEAREKLDRIRPATLGQAGRIDGVRAGDLAVLTIYLKKMLPPGAGEPAGKKRRDRTGNGKS
ncbi:MAG: tRNA uridine-5-carboxymethylaminomethyl(34) synthesis enzyme MnmG [Candidatus Krumholzibacteria bacterium]|nr:tRNA uridine-5-carboxymethylaminomethyl(34) synthesis enzyme MnmG [Candidatus Krumholzibacteria bacterium]